MIHSRTVDLHGTQLHFVEQPGKGPALVILHGITGSHTSFLPFLPALAQHAHVYVLDLRGHNLSSRTPGAYQVPHYGGDASAFLQTVVGRPAFVAGHSLGGLIAVWLAAQAPEWVRGIFLEDPPLYLTQMPRFQETGFYEYFLVLREHLVQHHARGGALEDLVEFVGESPANDDQTMLEMVGPEMVRERATQLHRLDPAVLEPALDGAILGPHRPDELLTQVRCPVRLLAGEYACGGAMDVQDVWRTVRGLSRCTHTVFLGVGHMVHQERPVEYTEALVQFVSA